MLTYYRFILFSHPETFRCISLYILGLSSCTEGVSDQSDGGPFETDGDKQRHTEPAALPHAQGESRAQP